MCLTDYIIALKSSSTSGPNKVADEYIFPTGLNTSQKLALNATDHDLNLAHTSSSFI